jgi:hypothetical protein
MIGLIQAIRGGLPAAVEDYDLPRRAWGRFGIERNQDT